MAANLSNIAFFDISEDQFTGIKPLEFTLDFGGNDYTDEELDESTETYGEEFKSFANFAIQIDVDKKITLGHLGEYILKSDSLWNLATRKVGASRSYPQWYLDLQNAIDSTKNVIGSTSSTSEYWTWSQLIRGYGGLIPLIEEISSLLGSISLTSDTSTSAYRSWSDWKEKYSSITGWIRDNSGYLDKILGTNWTSYNEFNSLPVRLLRLEGFTGVPTGGSVLPPKSLSQQIEDINTALGNKTKPENDTVYKRLDDLESSVYYKDDTISIDMSKDVSSSSVSLGGTQSGVHSTIVYSLFTTTRYRLKPNTRYTLNITGTPTNSNNLKASFRSLNIEAGDVDHYYGLPSVDEAPFISCDLSDLTDGSKVRIECPTHYLLVGMVFAKSTIMLMGSTSASGNPNVPVIFRRDMNGLGNYSGLDLSSQIFNQDQIIGSKSIPMGGWTIGENLLDLTRVHIISNYDFLPGKDCLINDTVIPLPKNQFLKLACPYYIDIKVRSINSQLHYFIYLTLEINPFMQHLFD